MINYDLTKIKAVVLDVDGVLSASTVNMNDRGEPLRTLNIKDGYAIQLAVKRGLHIAILTGGKSEALRLRYNYLGVEHVLMGCSVKVETYDKLIKTLDLVDSQVLYMGDDIPDYEIMKRVGCPCCPSDACEEIKSVSIYVSSRQGGQGCVRDVLEQVMKAQGIWMSDQVAFGW